MFHSAGGRLGGHSGQPAGPINGLAARIDARRPVTKELGTGFRMSNAPHFDIDPQEFWRDPYPALAAMRRDAPIAFVPQLGSTLLTRRDDIFVSEKRIDVFSSHQPAGLM